MTNNRKKILLEKLNSFQNELETFVIERNQKLFNKYFKQLKDLILNSYDKKTKEAAADCIKYLNQLESNDLKKSDIDKINKIISDKLGGELEKILASSIKKLNQKIYKSGINEIANATGFKLSFSVKDKNASNILAKQNLFWIGNYYSENLNKEISEILDGYYNSDKTISEVVKDFKIKFGETTKKGNEYFEGLAEHTTSRVSNLGRVTGFEKAGISEYEFVAIIDDRTSEICLELNGKVFTVENAISKRDEILQADSPEDIKKISPFLTKDDLQNLPGDIIPPVHYRCRSTIIARL